MAIGAGLEGSVAGEECGDADFVAFAFEPAEEAFETAKATAWHAVVDELDVLGFEF